MRLGRGLSKDEVERFAREDPRVKAHLDVIRRKELLEMCLGKMRDLRDLEVEERGRRKSGAGNKRSDGKKGWSLF